MNQIISICNPEALDTLTAICTEIGLNAVVTLHGKGTAAQSMLDLLGIENNEKRIVLAVAGEEETAEFIRQQKRRMFVGVPGGGIVVAVPIKSVGGGKNMSYLSGGKQNVKCAPKFNFDYELVVIITNGGTTDLVMDAARKAGARGGTVIHGKGTGEKGGSKFFSVSLANEREVVLIVAQAEQKGAIMSSILAEAGPDSPAGSVVFSMPVSEVAGIRSFAEEAEEK